MSLVFGDWGTTRLRLFRVENGAVGQMRLGPGIGTIGRPKIEMLRETLGDWLHDSGLRLVMCGMAGARIGLYEVAYAGCPADVESWAGACGRLQLPDVAVAIAAGLSCRNALGAADVMRGEETQIFGAMALDPGLASGEHLLVLPGTHSKWAWLRDGRIERFHTIPTGELFALLGSQSTLTRVDGTDDEVAEGFERGLMRAGDPLVAALFEARGAALLEPQPRGWSLSFLSGLLIGSEIMAARAWLNGGPVRLIGDPLLTSRYGAACLHFGIETAALDGESCAIAGLQLLQRQISWES